MIYTLGYSGLSADYVLRLAEELQATVVDIRLSPRSRRPEFNQGRLARLLGSRYVHIAELGNANYKNGGPIRILDLEAGLGLIETRLPGNLILMCACRDYTQCHRRVEDGPDAARMDAKLFA